LSRNQTNSLPSLQWPVTYPHSELKESSPLTPFQSYSLNVHFNNIFPYKPRPSKWLLPISFHHQKLVHNFNVYTCLFSPIRATWPAHLIFPHFITRIIFGDNF
jgi:hypothetical protein